MSNVARNFAKQYLAPHSAAIIVGRLAGRVASKPLGHRPRFAALRVEINVVIIPQFTDVRVGWKA